jgi:cytochrome P450 family 142 subfamily A polypeptide 1
MDPIAHNTENRTPDARPDVDLLAGETYANDVHAAFTWMRAHEPIYHDRANDLYAVTRHADVMAISKASQIFRNGKGFRPDSGPMPMMISMDRPAHMVRRNLVNRGFTPRRVAALEPRVRQICDQIIDDVAEEGSCDFVRDVAAWLPLIVIGDLLGVDASDYDKLLRWSDDLMAALGSTDPEKLTRQAQAGLEYRVYSQKVVTDRRTKPPGDDLMSVLVHADVDGERLDDDSLYMESLLILIGGDETTRHVISGGMHQLLQHPEQWDALRADPSKIERAVEEMLRWVSPIQNMMRTVAEPTEIGGHAFEEGDRLLLMYGSANRDEAVFDEPQRFDIARDPNPHVAFGGYGAHFCLGNALARLELRVMFEQLVARFPRLGLASQEPPPLRPANFVVGIETLPVEFDPIARSI